MPPAAPPTAQPVTCASRNSHRLTPTPAASRLITETGRLLTDGVSVTAVTSAPLSLDTDSPVVVARGLVKRYGSTVALDGLDLEVPAGTVLGLLGPNGAGKTTAVSILTTLIRPDAGSATVAGADVLDDPGLVRQRIGLSGQYSAVDEHLTGRENLEMIGRLYRLGRTMVRRRTDELLDTFRLVDAADRPLRTYSGGMRRRIDLAGSLIADPPVLFLDEPTTGLDPRSRTELWDIIRHRVAEGTTVLLTTQYLEEADQLADDIVVIDHGRSIAHGTADELKLLVGGEHLDVTVRDIDRVGEAATVLGSVASGPLRVATERGEISAPVAGGVEALGVVMRSLHEASIEIVDIGVRRPTLDDVFMELTGRDTGHDADTDADGQPQTRTPAHASAQPDRRQRS